MGTVEGQPSKLKVAAVVVFYMVAAMVMVFVNKLVLNFTPGLPLLLLFVQNIICVLLLHVCKWVSLAPGLASYIPFNADIPAMTMKSFHSLTPVSVVGITGIVFNTLCLKTVDASFFQIARGLVLPLTVFISAIASHQMPRGKVLRAAFVVTVGFFLGAAPSSYFSRSSPAIEVTAWSLIYGSLSSLMTAIHAVMIKSAQKPAEGHTVTGMAYWTNLIGAGALVPWIILNNEIETLRNLGDENLRIFVLGCAVTGFFGWLLCMAGLLSIKVTSPVTHMFSSAARNVIQMVLGVVIFGDVVTPNRASSIFVITMGTVYYTWIKSGPPMTPSSPPHDDDIEKGIDEKDRRI